MKNKEKVILALASLSFFLVVYFFIASKEMKLPDEKTVTQKTTEEKTEITENDLKKIKSKYRETVKIVYNSLQNDISEKDKKNINIDKELESFKGKLIDLTVPEEYKVFHLSFIMLIDKFLNNNIVLDDDFQNELNKIGENNSWLK